MMNPKESFKKLRNGVSTSLQILNHDILTKLPKGEIFWTIQDGKFGEETKGYIKNTVTLDASILIARLIKGTGTSVPHQSEPSFGAFALAVGTGDISWNPLIPPPATNTQRSLYNELARKTFSSTNFVDLEGDISGIPTNIVDLTTTFSSSEAVGPLTEMGILGGDIDTNMSIRNPILPPNGTYDPTVDVTGRDALVNYSTYPVINKTGTASITFTWRLTF